MLATPLLMSLIVYFWECQDSNPESCRGKQGTRYATILATHLPMHNSRVGSTVGTLLDTLCR